MLKKEKKSIKSSNLDIYTLRLIDLQNATDEQKIALIQDLFDSIENVDDLTTNSIDSLIHTLLQRSREVAEV